MRSKTHAKTGLARFRDDESGTFTIEVVIWSPLLIGCLLLIIDFSYLMMINAEMWHASRDAARAVSIHRITPDEAEAYLRDQLVFQRDDYDIEVRTTSADVVARVSLDAASAALTPIIGQYVMGDIGAQVAMLREPE